MNDRMAEIRAQRAVNAKAREEVRRIRQDCARDLNYNRSASTRHKLQRELDDAYARIEFLEGVVADAGISIDEDGAAPAQTGGEDQDDHRMMNEDFKLVRCCEAIRQQCLPAGGESFSWCTGCSL